MLENEISIVDSLTDNIEAECGLLAKALNVLGGELRYLQEAGVRLKETAESGANTNEAFESFESAKSQVMTLLERCELETEDLIKLLTLQIPQLITDIAEAAGKSPLDKTLQLPSANRRIQPGDLTSEQPSARVTAQNDADSPGEGSTIALTSEDLSSLALWLDGLAKFIDMTKAHLPELNNGRTLMCQRLYRHTMELKKRVREINGSS
jgi:hypothetical protein